MEKIISETDSEIEKLKDQAQLFIDEYWSVFKMHNRNYMNSPKHVMEEVCAHKRSKKNAYPQDI